MKCHRCKGSTWVNDPEGLDYGDNRFNCPCCKGTGEELYLEDKSDYYVFVRAKNGEYFERNCSLTEEEAKQLTENLWLLPTVEEVDISLSIQEVYEVGSEATYAAIISELGLEDA